VDGILTSIAEDNTSEVFLDDKITRWRIPHLGCAHFT
jgi:hypothetical protein